MIKVNSNTLIAVYFRFTHHFYQYIPRVFTNLTSVVGAIFNNVEGINSFSISFIRLRAICTYDEGKRYGNLQRLNTGHFD